MQWRTEGKALLGPCPPPPGFLGKPLYGWIIVVSISPNKDCCDICFLQMYTGANPGFSLGGGGGGGGAKKNMCANAYHEREARSPLRSGSRARLRALEALGGFDALSCYMSLILSILIPNGIKEYS